MVQKVIVAVLLLGDLVSLSVAQQVNDVRLDASRPSVYLTFERFGENDSVWLRLHNNTRWAISFRTEDVHVGANVTPLTLSDGRQVSGLADDLEIAPEHFIEHVDGVTTYGRYWCTASTSWLPSGRSVLFSFSRKALKEWDQLYIKFVYEWENGGSDPEHRVKFYGMNLQRTIDSSAAHNKRLQLTAR